MAYQANKLGPTSETGGGTCKQNGTSPIFKHCRKHLLRRHKSAKAICLYNFKNKKVEISHLAQWNYILVTVSLPSSTYRTLQESDQGSLRTWRRQHYTQELQGLPILRKHKSNIGWITSNTIVGPLTFVDGSKCFWNRLGVWGISGHAQSTTSALQVKLISED